MENIKKFIKWLIESEIKFLELTYKQEYDNTGDKVL